MIRVVRTLRALMADKPACQECGGELKAMDGKKALGAQLETECTACGRAHLVVVEEMAENRLPGGSGAAEVYEGVLVLRRHAGAARLPVHLQAEV